MTDSTQIEQIRAAYDQGWNDSKSEPRPFAAARKSMGDRYIAALSHPGQVREIAIKPLTYDEVEGIIEKTEPAQLSDNGDRIWTRRMAVALADLFNERIMSALSLPLPVQEPVAFGLIFDDWYGVNAETTFKTKEKAQAYADKCGEGSCKPKPRVVPLYLSPSPSIPEEKGGTAESVKWESPEEWEIEQRAFHAVGRDDVPVDVQQLVAKLWSMYCHAAAKGRIHSKRSGE